MNEEPLVLHRWSHRSTSALPGILMLAAVVLPIAFIASFMVLSGWVMGALGVFLILMFSGLGLLDWVRNRASELPDVTLTVEPTKLHVSGAQKATLDLATLSWSLEGHTLSLADATQAVRIGDLLLPERDESVLRDTLERASRTAADRQGDGEAEIPDALRAEARRRAREEG